MDTEKKNQDVDLDETVGNINKIYYAMNQDFINKREVAEKNKWEI